MNSYADLTSAIADWLNRDDLTTTAINQFIQLAESELNRTLRVSEMLRNAYADSSDSIITLPTDFLELRHLMLQEQNKFLKICSPAELDTIRKNVPEGGQPTHAVILNGKFEVAPVPTQTYRYEVLYFQKLPALSSTNVNNWLLLAHPDIYLYGALSKSAGYIGEDERQGLWASQYASQIGQLNSADTRKIERGVRKSLGFRNMGGNPRSPYLKGG
jgi:hypothetical protein